MARDATDPVTDLILETFRLNGALLVWGDGLVRDIGLTSSRWQVLGAIALTDRPMTVSDIARKMGLARQSVQRLVNELAADGLVAFGRNPDHARARLVHLTAAGVSAYGEADRRQSDWADAVAGQLDPDALRVATAVLRALRHQIDPTHDGDTDAATGHP